MRLGSNRNPLLVSISRRTSSNRFDIFWNMWRRFLSIKPIHRQKLHLVGVTFLLCLLRRKHLYPKQEVVTMEAYILLDLQFEVGSPTIRTFLRFDKIRKRVTSNGYFLWLTIGYGVGLLLTYLGLYLMDGHGQPALLYIVPCTLGLVVILGLARGELKELWSYGIEEVPVLTPDAPLPEA